MSSVRVGKILGLYRATNDETLSTTSLSFDEKGIINDKHYDKNIQRSVLIASQKSYALALSHGIDAPPHTLGENILMDYNPYHLSAGARITIGSLVLEISQNCTLCKSLAKVDTKLPKILKKDRGIFAKVISSGTIHLDDDIYIQTPSID